MKLDTVKADLEAILLVECPPSLRLAVIILWILTAHAVGLLWMFAGVYEREAVRAEVQAEVVELRNQARSLWGAFEYMKKAQDKAWVEGHHGRKLEDRVDLRQLREQEWSDGRL